MRLYSSLIILISFCFLFGCKKTERHIPGSLQSMDDWTYYRAYPSGTINMSNYTAAFQKQTSIRNSSASAFPGTWEDIGPKNFGGRTLCLAFNPQNPNTVLAGSAAGGLWRSYSGGIGANAWHPVPTGFPILGVAAIEYSPVDSNVIYIGTGEVYNYVTTGIGFVERTTRGSYGIGVLKSIDGGQTWTHAINWAYDDMKGVQDIKVNPANPNTVFAATSDGLYRSYDAGANWSLVHNVIMTTDINFAPNDTSVIYIGVGNSGSPGNGIYKSTDGGDTFTKLTNGLPTSTTGKTLIDIPIIAPNTIYASVADQFAQIGLYKSTDAGVSWTNINNEDVARYQGWYSHDVAVMPFNANVLLWVGVDSYRSLNGGNNVTQQAYWYNWSFAATPVGGPEGPSDYVHADVHRVYFKPATDSTFYLATDGGIFITTDAGATFSGHNGMYQTTQFYANVSSSQQDSLFFIGGMQDNATTIYEGNPEWRRTIGGDGACTAIHPTNDNTVYASSQRLNMYRSTNRAQNFSNNITPPMSSGDPTSFNGPFELSISQPNRLFCGSTKIFRSDNEGNTWTTMNGGLEIDGHRVVTIAVSPTDEDLLYCTTLSDNFSFSGIYKSTDGGLTFTNVKQNLPDRVYTDVAIDPLNNDVVYLALSGYNSAHIYKSTDAGASWSISDIGLPDVPHNTLQIDPLNPMIIYAGNDLGIHASIDGGATWQDFNDGLWDATLVMSLSVSGVPRKIRIGTHGKGIYERDMLSSTITSVQESASNIEGFNVFPNPTSDLINVTLDNKTNEKVLLQVRSMKGDLVFARVYDSSIGLQKMEVDLTYNPAGIYAVSISVGKESRTTRVLKN